jgi:hypothetical protein
MNQEFLELSLPGIMFHQRAGSQSGLPKLAAVHLEKAGNGRMSGRGMKSKELFPFRILPASFG